MKPIPILSVERKASKLPTGTHPMGASLGAGGGALAGAAMGTPGGPLGALIGSLIGAVVGGLAGNGIADAFGPSQSRNRW